MNQSSWKEGYLEDMIEEREREREREREVQQKMGAKGLFRQLDVMMYHIIF